VVGSRKANKKHQWVKMARPGLLLLLMMVSCSLGLPSSYIGGLPSSYIGGLPSSYIGGLPNSRIVKRQAAKPSDNVRITQLHVNSEIQFRYARTTVESQMKNFGNVAETTRFQAILPDKAFISNFSMVVGQTEYVAQVKPKDAAKKEFDQQVSLGSGAGLVEQDTRDANVFQINANIEPEEKVLFRLTYDELLERRFGLYEHVVHVQPGQVVDDFKIIININESLPISKLMVPEFKESNEVDFDEKESSIASIKRDLDENPKRARIEFDITKDYQKKVGKNGLQGEFSIQYDVNRDNQNNEIQVIDGHFVHFFTPENLKVLPKHIIFVLDVSGSMFGEKMQQLKDAMFTILDEMTDNDSFDIITFSTGVNRWSPDSTQKFAKKASKANKKAGIDFILSLEANGGTNINDALIDAINLATSVKKDEVLKEDVQTMILFLTDGVPTVGVTYNNEIQNNIKASNKEKLFPIFSLAFGQDADFGLIVDISKETGSRAKQIYEGSDAALQLEGFFQEISSPLLSDLTFEYVGNFIEQPSISNSTLKTFFKGSEFVVAGIISSSVDLDFKIKIRGKAGSEEFVQDLTICLRDYHEFPKSMVLLPAPPSYCVLPLPPAPRSDAQNFLKSLYAFLNIKQLLTKKDETSMEKALNLALENNFVTKLTSLVVTKDDGIQEEGIIGAAISKYEEQIPSYFPPNRITYLSAPSPNIPQLMSAFDDSAYFDDSSSVDYQDSYDTQDYNSGYSTTTTSTTTTTTIPVSCKLSLFSKTYRRGESLQLDASSADLGDFKDSAVTALVEGTCCWDVYAETGFAGAMFTLKPGNKYLSASSLGPLRRDVKSARMRKC